jgi:hypothetical protein
MTPRAYTPGEVRALIAPLFGIEAEKLDMLFLVTTTKDTPPRLCIQSNVSDIQRRLHILLAAIECDVTANTVQIMLCMDDDCDQGDGAHPHPRTEDCPAQDPPEGESPMDQFR